MPVQLTLRSPKGGRVLTERLYEDGHRIDAVSGWLIVVDRNGSTVAAHAACPGLEGAIVEHATAAAPYPVGETATYPIRSSDPLDDDTDDPAGRDDTQLDDDDPVPHEPTDLRPVEEDPRRPHLDAWPDDAVLLRYRELRRLVALHLERYEATPDVVRAMLEGDVPLRVSEVLT